MGYLTELMLEVGFALWRLEVTHLFNESRIISPGLFPHGGLAPEDSPRGRLSPLKISPAKLYSIESVCLYQNIGKAVQVHCEQVSILDPGWEGNEDGKQYTVVLPTPTISTKYLQRTMYCKCGLHHKCKGVDILH